MLAIDRQSTSVYPALNSAGIFFVASPMISRLRTKARQRVSSLRKASNDRSRLWVSRYSASASMWRRYSRGSEDILRFCQDSRTDEGRERFGRQHVDSTSQPGLKQVAEREKIAERLRSRPETHDHIDIAVGAGSVPEHRTKQREALYAEGSDLLFGLGEDLDRLVAIEYIRRHADTVAQVRPGRRSLRRSGSHTTAQSSTPRSGVV